MIFGERRKGKWLSLIHILPVVRTSPDHGTAYDIAGKGEANEESFREAIYTAIDVLAKREEYDEINANPLAFSKQTSDR